MRTDAASGFLAELMTDEKYERKVRHSNDPVMVTLLSSWDNNCKIIKSKIEELSRNFVTIKFYQVDVTKHAMLRSVFLDKELPTIVSIHNGEDFLTLNEAPSFQGIREGLEALQTALNEIRVG
ncbi:hypothetical protein PENARI_c004G12365 [Penicillium arizonense]|uniref:Thioredoxin domain-containing protein n=1 Tax=Penicillium arizonense TaxID=1835702 RepID=A0A1F5LRQ6_PENAI|nr:hypothetical protein PENARI_c004G12365 [Penicillium arizonense]OGE55786.1 hypothetical protein PENARI_c004G12365 [Penicillium arizonense]